MTHRDVDVLIVGAGQAGAQCAISLRQGGFTGSILVVGDEPDYPYERPPLSKDYLAGKLPAARLLLRPADFWAGRDIEVLLATRISAVDPLAHQAASENGDTFGYGHLVWAAGGRARRLAIPGGDLAGVHSIRERGDVDRLAADLKAAQDVAIIGAGYIGLEAAAVLVKGGKKVTILEAQSRVLSRVAGEPISRFYEAEHRQAGVEIRTSVAVERLEAIDGRLGAVILADGERIAADVAIVGIGLAPNIEPLAAAGAQISDGACVDLDCRTTLPDVFAIGDCACRPNLHADGEPVRLESVPNAVEQAKWVAAAILGEVRPAEALPWFWSNQYDHKLQTVGISRGFEDLVVRGDPETRSFSVLYLKQDRVIAVDAVNSIRDFTGAKQLIAAGQAVSRSALGDVGVALKDLVRT